MKFIVNFKDPDASYHGGKITDWERLTDAPPKVKEWFRYSEYVDIEIDTKKGTARVLHPKEDS